MYVCKQIIKNNSFLTDVLDEMAELFSPEEFLMALPENGSLNFLLPFITQSLQRFHLLQLKNLIMTKGKALLEQL